MLETDRLKLSRLSNDDAGFILQLLNEPSFRKFIGDKGVRNLDDARAYIRDVPRRQYEAHGDGLYRVALKEGETPIGICGLMRRNKIPDPDLGFAFLKEYWSNGYAYEASVAVLEQGRNEFGLQRILAMADAGNRASTRLLEKLGFRYEGATRMPGESDEVGLYSIGE